MGTIVLATPLATGTYHQAPALFAVEDIKNPDEAYRTIKELIAAATREHDVFGGIHDEYDNEQIR